jgi:hypothetical protein
VIALPLTNATRRLGAPAEWDHSTDGLCHTLEICDTADGFMVSAWQPSALELERLNAGKPVLLYIQGVAHPVVALEVPE